MRRHHVLKLLFTLMVLMFGFVFWQQADWWYYVGTGPESWPKFTAPAWEQIVVSSLVGSIFGEFVVGVASLFWWVKGACRAGRWT